MSRQLTGKRLNFRPAKPRSRPYGILFWFSMILGAVWLLRRAESGQIQAPFEPTTTPTRAPQSYILEAQAYFEAGKLDDPYSDQDTIGAYQRALQVDPENAQVLAALARIQAYSSTLLSTDQERLARLEEARDNILEAAALAPDDSTVLAIQAFVLDWNASSNLISDDERENYLAEAEAAANRAYLLDPENSLALTFYAEVLLDQQKWDQAMEYAKLAAEQAPDLMDTHRVYALVRENVGDYRVAIEEYKRAAEIAPNLTFLYLRIGLIYRHLQDYDTALAYFDKAASINKQLGVKDPLPYIAIAKAYAQQGYFFSAALNAETALLFAPTSADAYAQLGSIYVQARNYESARPALHCAIEGCKADENITLIELLEKYYPSDEEEDAEAEPHNRRPELVAVEPLELTNTTVAYYYIRYGSVLAYLSTPDNDFCDKTSTLMAELRATFPDDPILLQNIEDNEATCRILMDASTP